MRIYIGLVLFFVLFPCVCSCVGTGSTPIVHQVDLYETDDSIRVDVFESRPLSKVAVDVDARSASVPYGVNDLFHVGTTHFQDSTKSCYVYVFSLVPESVDTVSATTLRYHFTLRRNGRVMLMSARHPEGITEAFSLLDARVKKGWIDR